MGFMDRLSKAIAALGGSSLTEEFDVEKSKPVQEQKALMEDPFSVISAMGYKDKPFSLSYEMLKRMSTKNAVIASIITTRVNQVSTFTTPARFNHDGVGFEIRMRDMEATPNKKDRETMMALERFLENTGFDNDNSRDDFDTFIRKIVRDRLIYDQVTFEIVPDRKGNPAEFYAVDATTIRLASEDLIEEETDTEDEIKYVQVLNGQIAATFSAVELAFGVSNPRTDIDLSGYGFSELEMLIHQITSHIWAEEYNSRFFSQGGTTKGILNLKGTSSQPISPQQLDSFKRQWISQVSGMTGAWKTPVLSVDGLEYINVSQSNREMEFEKWMNYLINVSCAVYQIDPAEINFPNRGGASGSGGGGLGNGGIEDRLNHSRDKGLRPLLRYVEALINKNIVSRFDDRFVFSFVGLDSESEKDSAELKQTEVKVYKTVNEIRKEKGLEPLENGDIILDPTYIQYLSQMAQQQQMAQGGEEEGAEPEDGQEESATEPDQEESEYGAWDDEEEEPEEKEAVEKSLSKSLADVEKFLTIYLDDE